MRHHRGTGQGARVAMRSVKLNPIFTIDSRFKRVMFVLVR